MEVIHSRCAGIDISRKDAKVCVRVAGAGGRKTIGTVTTWSSMTRQILALRDHLLTEQRVPRPELLDPRDQHPDDRGRHRCRTRQHDPVPHRQTPGLLGRDHPRQQPVGREGQVQQDPPRQPLPAGRARRRCDGMRAEPTHLPGCPLPPDRLTVGDRRRPTSRSSTPCSSGSGTWAQPAPSNTTPAPSSSPDYDHRRRDCPA